MGQVVLKIRVIHVSDVKFYLDYQSDSQGTGADNLPQTDKEDESSKNHDEID